jgi:hypothetical protein
MINRGVDDLAMIWMVVFHSNVKLPEGVCLLFLVPSETGWNMDRITDNYSVWALGRWFYCGEWPGWWVPAWISEQTHAVTVQNIGRLRKKENPTTRHVILWFNMILQSDLKISSASDTWPRPTFWSDDSIEVEKIPVIKKLCPNMPTWSMVTWGTARRFLGWKKAGWRHIMKRSAWGIAGLEQNPGVSTNSKIPNSQSIWPHIISIT